MPCRYRVRARTHGSKIFTSEDAEAIENPDPTCNNEKLRAIIEDVSYIFIIKKIIIYIFIFYFW